MITGNRQQAVGNSRNLKLAACVLCAVILAFCSSAEAQQSAKKIPESGSFLSTGQRFKKIVSKHFERHYESWDTSRDKTLPSITASRTTTPSE